MIQFKYYSKNIFVVKYVVLLITLTPPSVFFPGNLITSLTRWESKSEIPVFLSWNFPFPSTTSPDPKTDEIDLTCLWGLNTLLSCTIQNPFHPSLPMHCIYSSIQSNNSKQKINAETHLQIMSDLMLFFWQIKRSGRCTKNSSFSIIQASVKILFA